MLKGRPVRLAEAVEAARGLIAGSKRRVAVVSSWGSNEELEAFRTTLGASFTCFVKADHMPEPGEVLQDDLLIRADKNPNTAKACELFGASAHGIPADAELVLVWGEGFDFGKVPRGARTILLGSYLAPENGHVDVFLPVSIQTERSGHYTNFAGVVSRFEACFPGAPGIADAAALFSGLAGVRS
jgi:NADH-quinone oxidoreductase subunit G